MDPLTQSISTSGPAPEPKATSANDAGVIDIQKQADASTLGTLLSSNDSRLESSSLLTQAVSALTQAASEYKTRATLQRARLLADYERNHPTARHELDLFLALHEVHQSDLEMFLSAAPDISTLSNAAQHIFNERQACA
jgi:hypothetical protein